MAESETPSFVSLVFFLSLKELRKDKEEAVGEVFSWFARERQGENRETRTQCKKKREHFVKRGRCRAAKRVFRL